MREILIDQRAYFLSEKKVIDRDIELASFINSRQIILITGVRRCGKSTLLYLIKNKMNIDEKNVFYFNFDDERIINFEPEDFNKLYSLQLELYSSDTKKLAIFFDEVQNAKYWEKFLNRMHEKGIKIFATGSNANILSGEISTTLTGRNLKIELFPFSFKEFLRYKKVNISQPLTTESSALVISTFNDYLKFGGFPLMALEENFEIIKSYYNDILYRDIITRWNITNVEEIKSMASFLAGNISKIASYSTIQDITHIKSLSSVKNYLNYMENSFLFFSLKMFDYSVKKQILNPRKIYIVDTAFESQIAFKYSENTGRILENVVFLHLKRKGKEIFYYKKEKECDFLIIEKNHVLKAIQVTAFLTDEDTKKREIEGLISAMKEYNLKEGLILTDNNQDTLKINDMNIIIKPIWKWLLEKD